MSNGRYILNANKEPVPEDDLIKWGKWIEKANRIVEVDVIKGMKVSTVFLGLDHSFGDGKPLLYETMIFGGVHDGYQVRYTTRKQALEGHEKTLQLVQ